MNILLNNIYYYPNLAGGAEVSVMKLSETLAKIEGNSVSVLAISENGEYIREVINGVTIYRLPLRGNRQNRLQRRINRVYNLSDYRLIFSTIQQIQPDVLHTNNLRTFSVAIWKAAYNLGIPIVHTLRDYVLIDIYKYKVEKYLIKHYSNIVSAITAPSLCTLNTHLNVGLFSGAKVKCAIPNAIDVDIDATRNLLVKKEVHRSKNDGFYRFAYIGRFSEEKGVDWLVKVFSKKMEHKELHLFGNGTLKPETIEIISKTPGIIEHGMLSERELNECLQEIDVVVVPSLWEEPFGRVILDAYKNGIPVIVTNRGGMPEIVTDAKTGLIIEPNDVNLSTAIDRMCNTDIINDMCNNILDVLPRFTVESQAEQFMELYKKII